MSAAPVETLLPHVLIVGSAERLLPILVAQLGGSPEWHAVPGLAGAAGTLPFFPDWILVVVDTPDEHCPTEIDSLFSQFALAQVVSIWSDWCDSAGRTRTSWPLASRTTWDELPTRVRLERDVWQTRRSRLPPTASRSEIELWQSGQGRLDGCRVRFTPPASVWLNDFKIVLQRLGAEIVDAPAESCLVELCDLDAVIPQTPVETSDRPFRIGLAGFPRNTHRTNPAEFQVDVVLLKTGSLETLVSTIRSRLPKGRRGSILE